MTVLILEVLLWYLRQGINHSLELYNMDMPLLYLFFLNKNIIGFYITGHKKWNWRVHFVPIYARVTLLILITRSLHILNQYWSDKKTVIGLQLFHQKTEISITSHEWKIWNVPVVFQKCIKILVGVCTGLLERQKNSPLMFGSFFKISL